MSRPFPIFVEAAPHTDAIEISIEFAVPLGAEARVAVTEIMTTFGAIGATGALSGDRLDPGQARLGLSENYLGERSGHWVFADARIDPASVCILLNMIHWIHLKASPIERLAINWPDMQGLADPLAIQFPELWPRLSFELEFGDLLDDIDVNIYFEEPQSEETSEGIVNTMAMWLLATHRGAYADDSFGPAESIVLLGPDVMDVRPERIIWFIEVLRCDESALDGLVNLLEWVHQRIAPIRRVEIGP
jgi:hypothetical protein